MKITFLIVTIFTAVIPLYSCVNYSSNIIEKAVKERVFKQNVIIINEDRVSNLPAVLLKQRGLNKYSAQLVIEGKDVKDKFGIPNANVISINTDYEYLDNVWKLSTVTSINYSSSSKNEVLKTKAEGLINNYLPMKLNLNNKNSQQYLFLFNVNNL